MDFALPKHVHATKRIGGGGGGGGLWRTGLVVRASDSGSGDPGSILGRVGVLFPRAKDIYSPKVLVIHRNKWLRLNMTEKLFTGTLNKNQNKNLKNFHGCKNDNFLLIFLLHIFALNIDCRYTLESPY